MTDPQNLDMQALQDLMLDAALDIVPFEGWTSKMMTQAAKAVELEQGQAYHIFPDGVLDMIDFWSKRMDMQAQAQIQSLDMSDMRIRDKITQAVIARLEAFTGHEISMRRAISRLSLPDAHIKGGGSLAARHVWASADMIWRTIGDKSTDSNYYSKRTILSGVLSATALSWLSDESPDKEAARKFLDARIENVMQFEKTKWAVKNRTQHLPNPAELLGRLRYGKPFSRRTKYSRMMRRGRYKS